MECTLCGKETQENRVSDVRHLYKVLLDMSLDEDTVICEACAHKTAVELKEEHVYSQVIKPLSRAVNNMAHDYNGTDTEAFLRAFTREHRTLQADMIVAFIKLFKAIGNLDEGRYFDPRNEWIRNWCQKAAQVQP